MGKKKGFNWRGRQVVNTVIDDSKTEQIKLELDGSNKEKYDTCNALVLPSEKRKTKVKKENVTVTKILSKTQRKRLETIVDRRKKKENRAALLEALAKVQATPEELKQLTSTSAVQTIGLRKYYQELSESKGVVATEFNSKTKLNSIKGSQKRKRLALLNDHSKKCKYDKSDPNIVGLDRSSSDESEDESENEKGENDDKEEDEKDGENDGKEEDEKDEEKNDKIESDTEKNNVIEKTNNEKNNEIEAVLDVTEKETSLHDTSVKNDNKKKKIESVKNKKAEVPKLNLKPVVRKPAVFVTVDRKPEIQAARLKLPILAEEQLIMEKINERDVVILAGETGSGKTTQIPQFLYEAGYAKEKMIGVTEPRRVAAISMSKRVGEEMNLSTDEISYLIRFEGNTTNDTKIKFMTDGVLLKEIQTDFLLTKYSVIILDEAHERSVYTDILIGLLSRIVPLRRKRKIPLKLIIMSATLRIADFTENKRLFKITPPVVKVESRQFPVTVHFNKRTNENYLKEAYNKAIKIHTQLPDGGILIFLTGQREVNTLVRKLRRAFPFRKSLETENTTKENNENIEYDSDDSDIDLDLKKSLKTVKQKKKSKEIKLPEINLDDYSFPANGEDIESVDGSDGSDEDDDDERLALRGLHNSQPLWTLPLYSLLPGYKQAKVFEAPPEGCRLCVVTTNVAETSLTIPHIKYVVDTGKTKARLYDKVTGVSTYEITWTSKAAADQRAGRAGRTGPGHCYRLYSSAVYNDTFKDFSIPEIQQKPVDDLYLQMKCLSIDKVVNFPFPSAPDLLQLKTAEKRLAILGALEEKINDKNSYRVTPLGQAISKFPVLPRFGKMLALSHQQDLLAFTVCMVASLSIQEVLLETPIFASNEDDQKALRQKWINTRRAWAGMGNSLLLGDPMVLLRAVGAAEYANANGTLEQFCNDNGLRHKAVAEIRKLRIQLTNEIKANMPEIDLVVDPKMAPPTDLQSKLLRQIILCGMADQVAHKVDHNKLKNAQERFKWRYAYHTSEMEEPIFMHSGSVLRKNMPEWVVFQEVYENSNTKKMYMRGVTAIEPEWLPLYAPKSCNLTEPLTDPQPRYDEKSGKVYCTVSGSFGKQNWPLPTVEILFPNTMEKYKWFGKFLLEGKIFKKLEKYCDDLLSTPNIMVKTWAKLQPRTELLLKNLVSRQIDSRQKLIEEWKKNPQYLLTEYQKWLPESAHNDIALNWPPIDQP